MRVLDLFCGLGGWSNGFKAQGFDVLGVEINQEIAKLYKQPVIVADVRTLDGELFKGFDVIVGSPPCRDFTQLPDTGHTPWKEPKNPERGLTMVHAFLRIIDDARPSYWLMENVKRLTEHLSLKHTCRARMGKGMFRYLWGKFPAFLIPMDMNKEIYAVNGRLRRWERAKIPFCVSNALAKACKEQLN